MTGGSESPPGALVISLDFELLWGVRDRVRRGDPYMANLMGARTAIPQILRMFQDFEIAATWATVGFLFATSRAELEEVAPTLRPAYLDPTLSPYEDELGRDETEDPLHFAASLVERIRSTPRQEIASHTFSHFYASEAGQNAESFRADLESALAIAKRRGIGLTSIVFPRNQHNREYDPILLEMGISAFRGNPSSVAWRFSNGDDSRRMSRRALRLLESYVPVSGMGTTPWSQILQPSGLSNVRASYPLRQYQPRWRAVDSLRLRRIRSSLHHAAERREVFHLWWHPHNFGAHLNKNLRFLRQVLAEVVQLRSAGTLASLTMTEVGDVARTYEGSLRSGHRIPTSNRE